MLRPGVTTTGSSTSVNNTTTRRAMDSMSKCHGMIGATGEFDCSNAYICLREPDKSEDNAECKATDNSVMGLTTSWYRRGETSVESSIPCSHERRVLVVKGAEEVENVKANSKDQHKAEGQRPRNFIRPVSMGF
ncbi:hypothetical protein GW17_00047496 [Ensete ventricosum]|nr:hypothetical protein GW17_00047496 [Ensete ventricosum]RZR90697.1 hypothetical protein BHM03_00018628 [Ensete ventricosum]